MEDDSGVDGSEYTQYYSKSAIRMAGAVKDMQAKLEKFSLNKVANAINGGAIKNDNDFTRQQIITADTILGTDITYKKECLPKNNTLKGATKTTLPATAFPWK